MVIHNFHFMVGIIFVNTSSESYEFACFNDIKPLCDKSSVFVPWNSKVAGNLYEVVENVYSTTCSWIL